MEDKKLYRDLKNYSILIAEDDALALDYFSKILKLYFKNVFTACDGEEAYKIAVSCRVDIILTDMYMPNQDGADFIKKLRDEHFTMPVIFMSAYKDSQTLLKVIPLNLSDYIIKPLRVEKVLRLLDETLQKSKLPSLEFANAKKSYILKSGAIINLDKKVVMKENARILMTKKEYDLLFLLLSNKQAILSKEQIEETLWNGDIVAESGVRTLMKKLRSKIGEESIRTIKNLGYIIELS